MSPEQQATNYTTASTAIAVMPFPFAVVPSYFLPHRRHSSAVMPFSLAVVCPSAVISYPRIIPHLDPLVITNTTNLFRSIDKISSNCIEKRRGLSPGGRFPPSFIHQVIIITGLNKLQLYVLALKMALVADRV